VFSSPISWKLLDFLFKDGGPSTTFTVWCRGSFPNFFFLLEPSCTDEDPILSFAGIPIQDPVGWERVDPPFPLFVGTSRRLELVVAFLRAARHTLQLAPLFFPPDGPTLRCVAEMDVSFPSL